MQPSVQADEFKNIIKRLPLTAQSLDSRGLYVYDDGFCFIVWFGRMLSPDIAMNLLGQDAAAELSKVCTVTISLCHCYQKYFKHCMFLCLSSQSFSAYMSDHLA